MGHAIQVERFRDRRGPAWHRIPNVWKPDVQRSCSEAMAEVGHGLDVIKAPLIYEMDGITYTSTDRMMVVRKPTADDPKPRAFGVVSNSWKLHQYVEMAQVFDKLSETHQVESAAVLKHGAMAFVTFKSGEWDVCGDPMESYFALNFSMQPGTSTTCIHTPIREVCWNTQIMAEAAANVSFRIPHTADTMDQLAVAAELLEKFEQTKAAAKEVCEAFAKRSLTSDEAKMIFQAAYPDPTMPAKLSAVGGFDEEERFQFAKDLDPNRMAAMAMDKQRFEALMDKRLALRNECIGQYSAFEPSRLGGTAWAAFNAVSVVADWRNGTNPGASTLFGERAGEKRRAFVAANQFVA